VYIYLTNAVLVNSLNYYRVIGILCKAVWLKKYRYKRGCCVYKITKGSK